VTTLMVFLFLNNKCIEVDKAAEKFIKTHLFPIDVKSDEIKKR